MVSSLDDVVVDVHLIEACAIFDWVSTSPSGYITPKIEIRRDVPGYPNRFIGGYAKEPIESGEPIVRVPWDLIITSDDPNEEEQQFSCGTVRSLAKELQLGRSSKYAPYVVYLNGEADAKIPSAWSEDGQELLMEVLRGAGEPIPPRDPIGWIEEDWLGRCRGDPNDPLGKKAALMVIERSDDAIMIPAYDNLNHRNGNWTNTKTEIDKGHYHTTTATRTIEPGEQIFISYNECFICAGSV
jgi:hypothetical protein